MKLKSIRRKYPLFLTLILLWLCPAGFAYSAENSNPVKNLISSSHVLSVPSANPVIDISWEVEGNITGHSLSWSESSDSEPDNVLNISGDITSIQSREMPDGHIYFHIKPGKMDGTWYETLHFGPVVIDRTPPEQPEDFTVREEKGASVVISWTNSLSEDLAGTVVRMSAVNYPASSNGGVLVFDEFSVPGESVSVVQTGFDIGKRYYFSIFSYDSILEGEPNFSYPVVQSVVLTGNLEGENLQIIKTIPANDPSNTAAESIVENIKNDSSIEVFFNQKISSFSPDLITVKAEYNTSEGELYTVSGRSDRGGENKIIFYPLTSFVTGENGIWVTVTVHSGFDRIASISDQTLDGNYNATEDSPSVDSYNFRFFVRPEPVVESVETSSNVEGSVTLSIVGKNFIAGSQVVIRGINIDSVRYIDHENLEVTLATVEESGNFDVTVINPDNQKFTLQDAFYVEAPVPVASNFGLIVIGIFILSCVYLRSKRDIEF